MDFSLLSGSSDRLVRKGPVYTDAADASRPLTDHQQAKQAALNSFTTLMGSDKLDAFNLLKQAANGERIEGNSDRAHVLSLFDNSSSFWSRKCPESAALAMVGMALNVFGSKILDESGHNIDHAKLQMALHMLFGKLMPSLGGDLNHAISGIRLKFSRESADYVVTSKNYSIEVPDPGEISTEELSELVNSQNIDKSYFQKISMRSVADFFGTDNIPADLHNSTGQVRHESATKIGKRNLGAAIGHEKALGKKIGYGTSATGPKIGVGDEIGAMSQPMKRGEIVYSRTTKTVTESGVIEDQMICSFLTDSAPSATNDKLSKLRKSGGDLAPELLETPINVYCAEFRRRDGGQTTTSHVTCCGSQYRGTPEENVIKAGKIVQAIKTKSFAEERVTEARRQTHAKKIGDEFRAQIHHAEDLDAEDGDVATELRRQAYAGDIFADLTDIDAEPRPAMKRIMIFDIRLLAQNKLKGDEQGIYGGHTGAMRRACEKEGVGYFPVFQEAHTLGEGRVSRLLQRSPLTEPGEADDQPDSMKTAMRELFSTLPRAVWRQHADLYNKWEALYDQRDNQTNAIPFATLTKILSDVISKHTGTHIEVLMGCKSAKDRTTSVLAGISMLELLLLGEIARPSGPGGRPNIQRFFTTDGRLNYEGLTPGERVLLQDLYDISLLQSANKLNVGAETNVSYLVLREFFKHVDFIGESEPRTVAAHG